MKKITSNFQTVQDLNSITLQPEHLQHLRETEQITIKTNLLIGSLGFFLAEIAYKFRKDTGITFDETPVSSISHSVFAVFNSDKESKTKNVK